MSRIPCSRCAKGFRTEKGLRWHLLHIHDCRDVEELLMEPAPARLAKAAVWRELDLAAFAAGLGSNVPAMQNLISRHFPEYGSGSPIQEIMQRVPPVSRKEPLSPSNLPYMPPMLPGTSPDLSHIDHTSLPMNGRIWEGGMG